LNKRIMASNFRINGVSVADVAFSMLTRSRSHAAQTLNQSSEITNPPSSTPISVQIPNTPVQALPQVITTPISNSQATIPSSQTSNKKKRKDYEKHSFQEIYCFLKAIQEVGEGNPEAVLERLHMKHIFESWKNDASGHTAMSTYLRELKVEKRSCLLKHKEFKSKAFQAPTTSGIGRTKRRLEDHEVRALQEAHINEQVEEKNNWEKARELLLKMINEEKLGSTSDNITEEELLEAIEHQGKKRKSQKDVAKGRLMNAFTTDMSSREKLNQSINHYGVLLERAHEWMEEKHQMLTAFYEKLGIEIPKSQSQETSLSEY